MKKQILDTDYYLLKFTDSQGLETTCKPISANRDLKCL